MSDFSGRTPKKLDISIQNPWFWPQLNLGELQEDYRIPSEYREKTIKAHFFTALIEVNRALEPFACEHYCQYGKLEHVPAYEFGLAIPEGETVAPEEHELIALYKTAVYSRAAAKIWHVYATANRRDQQTHDAREADDTEHSYMVASDQAIRLIQGDVPAVGLRAAVL